MSTLTPDEQARFRATLADALQKAATGRRPRIAFVRYVEAALRGNASDGVARSFPEYSWKQLDCQAESTWSWLDNLPKVASNGPAEALLLSAFPLTADGELPRAAVTRLEALHWKLRRRESPTVLVVTPTEVDAIMRRLPQLWSERSAYTSWPERSVPLPDEVPGEEPAFLQSKEGEQAAPRPSAAEGLRPEDVAPGEELLLAAATLFQSGHLEHAGARAVQALGSFEAAHDAQGTGESRHLLGMIAEKRDDVDSSIAWYEKARQSYLQAQGTDLQLAILDERLGQLHYGLQRFEMALTMFRRALERDELRADEARISADYRHMALVLERLEQLPQANEFAQRALEIERKKDNPAGLARCYLQLGRISHRLGQITEANSHLELARKICEELGDNRGLSAVYHELGNADLKQELYPEAVGWYSKAIAVDKKRNDSRSLVRSYAQVGHALAEAGDVRKALRYLLRSHHHVGLLGPTLSKAVLERIHSLRADLDPREYRDIVEEVDSGEHQKAAAR